MEISGSNDLIAATRLRRIGDQVEVTFERDRRVSVVRVTLREQRE
jgi:S1-C subfamily serine protease